MKVWEFQNYLRGLTNSLGGEEGIMFGDASAEVRVVQVSWMGDVAAARNAIRIGADLMLVHEAPFFPYPGIRSGTPPTDCLSWAPNRERIRLYTEGRMAVLRLHSTLDKLCIYDDFARTLGLDNPVVDEEGFIRIYAIEPATLGNMIEQVKKRLHLDSVRVSGGEDLSRTVSRIGLPWGGTGLFVNVDYQAALLRHKPDLFIAGETDTYGMHFARDAGVPMIETGHEVSENIGLRNFTERLRRDLPGLRAEYFENPRPWVIR